MTRLVGLLAWILSLPSVNAAEFTCMQRIADYNPGTKDAIKSALGSAPADSDCAAILLSGPIVSGDTRRLEAAFRDSHGLLSTVNLNSPGGNIREAMDLGRFVRRALIRTNAPWEYVAGDQFFPPLDYRGWNPCRGGGCACASACFVLWAAGVNRVGHALSVHRPRFEAAYFSGLELHEAQYQYNEALNALKQYFQEMDVPAAYYDRMVSTPSADLRSLSRTEAETLWVNDYPPAIDEWLISKCGALSAVELEHLQRYGPSGTSSRTPGTPDPTRTRLLNKFGEISACRARVIVQARFGISEQLPALEVERPR